jgi:hypothetical protein
LRRRCALICPFALLRIAVGAFVAQSDETFHRRTTCIDGYRSRDVIERQELQLRVVSVPDCGWIDLGTPQRVAETLHRLSRERSRAHTVPAESSYPKLAFAKRPTATKHRSDRHPRSARLGPTVLFSAA